MSKDSGCFFGKPATSRAWHIFLNGRSLCLAWLYTGADEPVREGARLIPEKGDCKKCFQSFNAVGKPPANETRVLRDRIRR
jgi:hypothetical protein